MLISDHIGSFILNPLVGENWDDFGPRFPDMSQCYSLGLRHLARHCAKRLNMKLREGTYVAVSGPSYETPAEIGMFRKMGGDAIGMSTVLRLSSRGTWGWMSGNLNNYESGGGDVKSAAQSR